MRDVFRLVWKEGTTAGRRSQLVQNLVAAQDETTVVGRDGINDHFGALCYFNGLRPRVLTLVVLAVTHYDDSFAHRMIGTFLKKLIAAGVVDSIVKRRTTTIAQAVHARRKQPDVIGEILRNLGVIIEAEYESLVKSRPQHVLKKAGSGLLFEIETGIDRPAHIDEQPHFQGQIGFAVKFQYRLRWFMIIENSEVALHEIADELAMLVSGNK